MDQRRFIKQDGALEQGVRSSGLILQSDCVQQLHEYLKDRWCLFQKCPMSIHFKSVHRVSIKGITSLVLVQEQSYFEVKRVGLGCAVLFV